MKVDIDKYAFYKIAVISALIARNGTYFIDDTIEEAEGIAHRIIELENEASSNRDTNGYQDYNPEKA